MRRYDIETSELSAHSHLSFLALKLLVMVGGFLHTVELNPIMLIKVLNVLSNHKSSDYVLMKNRVVTACDRCHHRIGIQTTRYVESFSAYSPANTENFYGSWKYKWYNFDLKRILNWESKTISWHSIQYSNGSTDSISNIIFPKTGRIFCFGYLLVFHLSQQVSNQILQRILQWIIFFSTPTAIISTVFHGFINKYSALIHKLELHVPMELTQLFFQNPLHTERVFGFRSLVIASHLFLKFSRTPMLKPLNWT